MLTLLYQVLDTAVIERLIVILITFLSSSVFSTLVTLYVTRNNRKVVTLSITKNDEIKLAEMISKYATNVTQDAERLLTRLEKTESKLEETRTALTRCLDECNKLKDDK